MLSPIRPACLPPVTRPLVAPDAQPQPQPQPQPQQAAQEDWRLTLARYTPGPGLSLPAGLTLWAHLGPQLANDAQVIGRGLAGTAQGAWSAISSGAQQLWSGLFSQPQPPAGARLVLPAEPAAASPPQADARALRRAFRETLGRDATAAEVEAAQARQGEGASLRDLKQAWACLPEARIARIFEDEIGRPIEPQGRRYWLNEYENGQGFTEIRERLRAHTDYMRAKGYIR